MPHARSYLIHRIASLEGDLGVVLGRLASESDVSIRQALLLIAGNFDWDAVEPALQAQVVEEAKTRFKDDRDIAVHSAARWALQRNGHSEWVNQTLLEQSELPADPRKNWRVNAPRPNPGDL